MSPLPIRQDPRQAPAIPVGATAGAAAPPTPSAAVRSPHPVFSGILHRLAQRCDLTQAETAAALELMAAGEVGEGEMAAFLMGLRVKGETADEIAGLVQATRRLAVPVATASERVVDVVGTGGDGLHTFNISTTAAFVVAGAGVKVAKHGNRAASSRCGSADVLEALGVVIDLEPEDIATCIERVGMGFMPASRHHPAAGRVAGVRRSLGVRTVFNFLGPLANPAGVRRQLLGVGAPDYLEVLAEALARVGCERALVVCGHDGMDELSVTGLNTVVEVTAGSAGRPYILDPGECGVALYPLQTLAGGDPQQNAAMTRAVLAGAEGGPRDAVLLNAGAALYVAGAVPSIREGVAAARLAVDDGSATAVLEGMVALTRELAARRRTWL